MRYLGECGSGIHGKYGVRNMGHMYGGAGQEKSTQIVLPGGKWPKNDRAEIQIWGICAGGQKTRIVEAFAWWEKALKMSVW